MGHRIVERYYRQEHFDFYRDYRSPFYSVTFALDATRVKAFADQRGYSTYANLCYFFTRGMQEVEDFRYRWLDGRMVLYDRLHVGLTVPAPDGRFSFAYLAYHPDPHRYNARARPLLAAAAARVSLSESRHRNFIFFTALPGVPFTAFTHVVPDDPTEGEPRVAFGRYSERGRRLIVPVGLQVNHAFIDGAALGALMAAVERAYAEPG